MCDNAEASPQRLKGVSYDKHIRRGSGLSSRTTFIKRHCKNPRAERFLTPKTPFGMTE